MKRVALIMMMLLPAGLAHAQNASEVSAPPAARRADVVDDYHGVKVADPYRWLEDVASPETQAYAKAQNARFRAFVDSPARDAIRKRLAELIDYRRVSLPQRLGNETFFRYIIGRNTGLQNQDVYYVRDGTTADADVAGGALERLLPDPNTLSADGTIALSRLPFTLAAKPPAS